MALFGGVGLLALALAVEVGIFDYDRSKPLDVQVLKTETRDGGVEVRDITFASLSGRRTEAYLIVPPGKGPFAGVLYVHWYEPPKPTSNRTQFLDEAVELARRGVVSVLPATMWSDPDWFRKRKREDDLKNSLAQTRELRRAFDLLLAQPGVDARRAAYAGHDFGAMFGAVIAGVDRRPVAYALQAGTTAFPNWYLFGPPMKEPARSEFVRSLAVLDGPANLRKAPPSAPVFLQFATHDIFVSQDQADELWRAVRGPREISFYEAEHEMNDWARRDRVEWLAKVLRLGPGR
jgi:dienelactone hydrolase